MSLSCKETIDDKTDLGLYAGIREAKGTSGLKGVRRFLFFKIRVRARKKVDKHWSSPSELSKKNNLVSDLQCASLCGFVIVLVVICFFIENPLVVYKNI